MALPISSTGKCTRNSAQDRWPSQASQRVAATGWPGSRPGLTSSSSSASASAMQVRKSSHNASSASSTRASRHSQPVPSIPLAMPMPGVRPGPSAPARPAAGCQKSTRPSCPVCSARSTTAAKRRSSPVPAPWRSSADRPAGPATAARPAGCQAGNLAPSTNYRPTARPRPAPRAARTDAPATDQPGPGPGPGLQQIAAQPGAAPVGCQHRQRGGGYERRQQPQAAPAHRACQRRCRPPHRAQQRRRRQVATKHQKKPQRHAAAAAQPVDQAGQRLGRRLCHPLCHPLCHRPLAGQVVQHTGLQGQYLQGIDDRLAPRGHGVAPSAPSGPSGQRRRRPDSNRRAAPVNGSVKASACASRHSGRAKSSASCGPCNTCG